MSDRDAALLRLLATRLEHLSADSRWAHRSSGIRGTILRVLDQIENKKDFPIAVEELLNIGFELLNKCAHQIPDPAKR